MTYELYINEQLCDLDDKSLIVLTYTMEQLNNPTAVKNSYSHEVELPSTERNDIIFSHFYRNDYKVGVETFTPIMRVPFAIYNELGEIVERGYIKLDEVAVDKANHTYKVVLYGGLGSFFYAIGFNDNGEALTLGDLQYMANTSTSTREELLNLSISRATVGADGAWGRLAGRNGRAQFDVINFAPTYQGVPSDFDADKAIYIARAEQTTSGYGDNLANPIYGIVGRDGGKAMYKRIVEGTDTGYRFSIFELGKEHTEWEVKDLRSYLQRPILSVRKFVEAIQRRATANGYTLNLDSSFFNADNPYYGKAWLTLPSLQSITKPSKTTQTQISANIVIDESAVQEFEVAVNMPTDTDGYEFGTTVSNFKATLPRLSVNIPTPVQDEAGIANTYSLMSVRIANGRNAWFVQLYGTTAGNVVAWSDTKVLVGKQGHFGEIDKISTSDIVSATGYVPKGGGSYEKVGDLFIRNSKTGEAVFGNHYTPRALEFNTTIASTPDAWHLRIEKYHYYGETGTASQLFGWTNSAEGWVDFTAGEATSLYGTAEVSANETIRTGTVVNKSDLLNIGKSPLEVLLSYSKLFGLVWHYEPNSKSVTLGKRSTFYREGVAVDWQDRIDRARPMKIRPFEFDKRFYDFELETQGAWPTEYEAKYSRIYGSQRVNTGYDFDKEEKNLLEGNALRGGAEVLQQSKYYTNITEDGKVCPSVFLDGAQYALYDSSDNATEYEASTPTKGATIEYMNTLQGYDYKPKLQLHDGDSSIDEGGTLLIFNGNIEIDGSPYRNFHLSDDVAEMGLLNEGNLCWVLEGSVPFSLQGETIPHFVRTGLGVSLDMGVPQEVDNPDADKEAVNNSIYSQYWSRYLGDRYDVNSRVLECYVDLRGLQVSNALFRNFYYFDNAVWVLNKITNYSMTTEGTTQCEFVKVQDVNNYKEA